MNFNNMLKMIQMNYNHLQNIYLHQMNNLQIINVIKKVECLDLLHKDNVNFKKKHQDNLKKVILLQKLLEKLNHL